MRRTMRFHFRLQLASRGDRWWRLANEGVEHLIPFGVYRARCDKYPGMRIYGLILGPLLLNVGDSGKAVATEGGES